MKTEDLIDKYKKERDGIKKYTNDKHENRIRHLATSKIMLYNKFIQDLKSIDADEEKEKLGDDEQFLKAKEYAKMMSEENGHCYNSAFCGYRNALKKYH